MPVGTNAFPSLQLAAKIPSPSNATPGQEFTIFHRLCGPFATAGVYRILWQGNGFSSAEVEIRLGQTIRQEDKKPERLRLVPPPGAKMAPRPDGNS
jgi:hypothetical protein